MNCGGNVDILEESEFCGDKNNIFPSTAGTEKSGS